MKGHLATIFMVLTVSSLSLGIVRLFGGYSLTLAAFFVLLYLAKSANKIQMKHMVVLFALICFLLGNAVRYSSQLDFTEFFKSFGQTFFFLFCYITSFSAEKERLFDADMKRFLIYSTLVIIGFEFFQLLEQTVFGSTSSWFWLDGISISTAEDVSRFEAVNLLGFFRPISFFHEPSYLGTVLFVLFVYNDQKVGDKRMHMLLLLGILLTLSATVMIFLVAYLLLGMAEKHRRWLIVLLLIGAVAAVYSTVNVLSFLRITEITTVGTSGWVRLMLPMMETLETIRKTWFGIPLGQNSFIFDNSFFLILSYFGIATPILFLVWVLAVRNRLKANFDTIRYMLVFALLLFLNGAIFTMESAFLSVLINFSFFDRANIL